MTHHADTPDRAVAGLIAHTLSEGTVYIVPMHLDGAGCDDPRST